MVGVSKVLIRISECSFDSGSDKARPSAQLVAMEFHLFLDWEFEDWLAACKKHILFGVQREDLGLWLFKTFAFFFIFVASMQIVIADEPELPSVSPEMMQD